MGKGGFLQHRCTFKISGYPLSICDIVSEESVFWAVISFLWWQCSIAHGTANIQLDAISMLENVGTATYKFKWIKAQK